MSLTPSEAINRVFKRLANRTPTSALRLSVIDELNAAQIEFESGPEYPFFLEKVADDNVITVNSSSDVTFPADYIALVEEKPITYVAPDGNEVDLELRSYEECIAKANYTAENGPIFIARKRADVYTIFPRVSTGFLRLYYYASQPRLDQTGSLPSGTTNYWYRYAPFLLVCKAAYEIAGGYLKDQALAEKLKLDTADKYQQLIALNVTQESNMRDLSQMPFKKMRGEE